MEEFAAISETSQQSSDQSKISRQQAGPLGKIILAFANTSSQYARITKRAIQDLYNRRGSDKANIAKIVYYAGLQNLVFNFFQQAMFAAMWGDEDDEEILDGKKIKTLNSMADGMLRGMGWQAAVFAALKNTAIKLYERSKKKNNKDYAYHAIMGILAVSPPISSKMGKVAKIANAYEYNQDQINYGDFSINSPELIMGANAVAFATSIPLDRVLQKSINISDAIDDTNAAWQRIFMVMGWPKWTLITSKDLEEDRKEQKESLKIAKSANELKQLSAPQLRNKELKDLKKDQQIDTLKKYGLSTRQIKLLKYEQQRIDKIKELQDMANPKLPRRKTPATVKNRADSLK
jgi:hypothetical protein